MPELGLVAGDRRGFGLLPSGGAWRGKGWEPRAGPAELGLPRLSIPSPGCSRYFRGRVPLLAFWIKFFEILQQICGL